MICVVDTGSHISEAIRMVTAVMIAPVVACAKLSFSLHIFSPMVTTIRFHPIMVPSPRETEIMSITHQGA